MWTDAKTDSPRPARDADGSPASCFQQVPPEHIAYYVARGRQLRAQAIARIARQLTGRVRALFGRAVQAETAGAEEALSVLAGDFRSPLTAIRSSAEILRDNPDIDSSRRKRFVDIVLIEEARLEALVTQMLDASKVEGGSRAWQLELDELRLGQAQGSCR